MDVCQIEQIGRSIASQERFDLLLILGIVGAVMYIAWKIRHSNIRENDYESRRGEKNLPPRR